MGIDLATIIYLIILIATIAISLAMAPKPVQLKPDSIEDAGIPTADPSRFAPVLFGTRTIKKSNVVWYGDLLTIPIYADSGKK